MTQYQGDDELTDVVKTTQSAQGKRIFKKNILGGDEVSSLNQDVHTRTFDSNKTSEPLQKQPQSPSLDKIVIKHNIKPGFRPSIVQTDSISRILAQPDSVMNERRSRLKRESQEAQMYYGQSSQDDIEINLQSNYKADGKRDMGDTKLGTIKSNE